jgi:hypothetical protein
MITSLFVHLTRVLQSTDYSCYVSSNPVCSYTRSNVELLDKRLKKKKFYFKKLVSFSVLSGRVI